MPLIEPYSSFTKDKALVIRDSIHDLELKSGGIVFDEIEIRSGLVWRKSTQELVGLTSHAIPAHSVHLIAPELIETNLATHIVQVKSFFLFTIIAI